MKQIKVITSDNYADKRGLIWTSWKKNNLNLNFEHDKFSFSKKNVLRGLHYDNKTWKLISCPYGKIFFVVVNCSKYVIYFIGRCVHYCFPILPLL